jgi:hypothetical protein
MVLFWTVPVPTVNVTFYFYYVCTYREVKTPILQYRTITCVGIVQFEGKTPSSNTKKNVTMVVPCDATVAWLWQISQYMVASLEGGGRGQGRRILCNYVNRRRNIFLVNLTYYFIILIYCLLISAKMME